MTAAASANAQDDSRMSNCDCCTGIGPSTPGVVFNRPGLSAIAYRSGTWHEFKESLLAALADSQHPELAGLATRADDDFSIALLDAVATVGDVLSFYRRAHRQRVVSAHRHRARLRPRARATHRLRAQTRRRREHARSHSPSTTPSARPASRRSTSVSKSRASPATTRSRRPSRRSRTSKRVSNGTR